MARRNAHQVLPADTRSLQMETERDFSPRTQGTACIRCAKRKVRCDRQDPCKACVRHKVDCIYEDPQATRKRRKLTKDDVLIDRLKFYENLLRERGVEAQEIPDFPTHDLLRQSQKDDQFSQRRPRPSNHSSTAPRNTEHSASRARIARSRGESVFLENNLWSRLAEELQDAASDVEPEYDEPSDSEISGTDLSFVLQTHTRPRAQSRSITSGHMKHLWDVFVQNIDPLTKIVHVPTLRSTLDQANEVDAPISKPLSALLAAICSTAVMSLNDCDCLKDLGDSRAVLLSKYIKTTQTALTRARFIETTDLRVLQALALHLLSIQETSTPRTLWGLAGVAIRISQAMGLDRDGLYLGLSHFESELRRRLWWFLKTYDHRFADLCGLSKFRDLNLNPESPNWPANVDDAHLHPEMSTMPEAPRGLTDAAFIAVKYEFVSFAAGRVANLRQQGKTADEIDQQLPHEGGQEATQVMLDEVQELLETKYLRYCDPSKPLHLMTSLMARAAINTIQFLAHHPRHWPDRQGAASDERETAWKISIKLMEQLNILQSNPLLKPYAWYAAFVMQFHALIHVLDTLYEEPLVEGYQKAWDLIAGIYESNTGMISDTRKPIHLAIGGLCLKAYKKRTTALQQKGMAPVRDPGYIVELQRQRATAYRMRRTPKTSRCGVGQSSMREGHSDSANDSTTLGSDQARDASHISRSDGLDSSSHGYANKASYGPSELGTNSSGTMMDFGLDLAGWDTLEDEDGKSHIPWEQWDAWVAASGDMDGGLSWL